MKKRVIVIPTYNEVQNIQTIISSVRGFASDAYILVVDDNSPDGTAAAVQTVMEKDGAIGLLNRKEKEGLGPAYVHAFSEILKDPTIEWIQMMDADFSHDPRHVPELFSATAEADLVIGSRYIKNGGVEGWELGRRLLSSFAGTYCRHITGMPVYDATSGFNLIRASYMRKVLSHPITSKGYAFQIELKHRLWKHGARIIEVPIIFKDRVQGVSKMSGSIILEGIVTPWKLRLKHSGDDK